MQPSSWFLSSCKLARAVFVQTHWPPWFTQKRVLFLSHSHVIFKINFRVRFCFVHVLKVLIRKTLTFGLGFRDPFWLRACGVLGFKFAKPKIYFLFRI